MEKADLAPLFLTSQPSCTAPGVACCFCCSRPVAGVRWIGAVTRNTNKRPHLGLVHLVELICDTTRRCSRFRGTSPVNATLQCRHGILLTD